MPRIPEWLKEGFEEAIAYQKGKVALPVETTSNLEAEYHDFAFVVSGLTRADLASDLLWLIERALADGLSLEDFIRQFDRLIGRKGWQPGGDKPRRLHTILDTNTRRAHAAGRLRQMREPAVLAARPYWMWQWRDSVVPRPNHKALHGKVFLASDPFWDVAFPSCGYGCRCSVFALSDRDLKRMGKTVSTPPDPETIADKGFRRAPGTAPQKDKADILRGGLSRQSEPIRKAAAVELRKRGINLPVFDRADRSSPPKKRNCRQGFPCKGTCISKLKKCTSTTPGEPRTHKEYIDRQIGKLIKAGRDNDIEAVLYTARRISRLPSERARKVAVAAIRDRLSSSEEFNAVLEAVDIEEGIKNPKQLAENIAKLRLKDQEDGGLTLSYKPPSLKPIPFKSEDIDALDDTKLTDIQRQAKTLVLESHSITKQMNDLLDQVNDGNFNDEQYQATYNKLNELTTRLKVVTDNSKNINGKVQHPILDERIDKLSTMSKEALPGYGIVVPKDLNELKTRAKRRDC